MPWSCAAWLNGAGWLLDVQAAASPPVSEKTAAVPTMVFTKRAPVATTDPS
jgi:hypothetical protein